MYDIRKFIRLFLSSHVSKHSSSHLHPQTMLEVGVVDYLTLPGIE
jgi:hypothetical protein